MEGLHGTQQYDHQWHLFGSRPRTQHFEGTP